MTLKAKDLRRLPPMLNAEQVGKIVGLHKLQVSRLLRHDKFVCPGVKVGGSWRIPRDELLEALGLGDEK